MYFVMFFAMVQTFIYDIKIIDRLKIDERILKQYLEPYKMVRNRLQEWMEILRTKSRMYLDQTNSLEVANDTVINDIYYDKDYDFMEERYQMERMIFVVN